MESQFITDVRKSVEDSFASGWYCAESVVLALAKAQGVESGLLPKVATAFCSGMARTCGTCGALTGAIMGVKPCAMANWSYPARVANRSSGRVLRNIPSGTLPTGVRVAATM